MGCSADGAACGCDGCGGEGEVPGEVGRWADDGGSPHPNGRPITGPAFASWDDPPGPGADDPRTAFAAKFLAAALTGAGTGGLCNLIRRKPQSTLKEVGTTGRDAVEAAFLLADEFLRQAWGEPAAEVAT